MYQASLLDAAVHSSTEAATTEGEREAAIAGEEGFCRHDSREADLLSLHISDMLCDDDLRQLRSLSLRTRRSAALSCFVRGEAPASGSAVVEVAASSFSSRTILSRPGFRMDSPATSSSDACAASRLRRSRATVYRRRSRGYG